MRTELNEDAVFEAMRSLLARGQYPSQARVRDELGSTASAQTIGRFVAAGYKRLAGDKTSESQPLPHYVTQAATRLHHEISEQERGLAEEAIEEAEAVAGKYKLDLDSARSEHDETREQMAYLRQQFEATADERDRCAEQVDALTDAATHDRGRIDHLETRLADSRREAARTIRSARATHRQVIHARDGRIAELQSELSWLKSYSEDERNRLSQEIDRERQTVKVLEARNRSVLQEKDRERREHAEALEHWSTRAEALQQGISDVESREHTLQHRLTRSTEEVGRLRSDLKVMKEDRDRLHVALQKTEQNLSDTCRDRDIAQALANDRRDQLAQISRQSAND